MKETPVFRFGEVSHLSLACILFRKLPNLLGHRSSANPLLFWKHHHHCV